jgi:hypothetical protein
MDIEAGCGWLALSIGYDAPCLALPSMCSRMGVAPVAASLHAIPAPDRPTPVTYGQSRKRERTSLRLPAAL